MKKEELQSFLSGKHLLAPLTRAGNLPFRRLCVEYGADITYSEMAYARQLVKGARGEHALLRRHSSEKIFGVQLAALQTEEALAAAEIVLKSGADFIDINCGCPVDEVTRRGLGAALLRRPNVIVRLVEAFTKRFDVAVTVKLRLGWKENSYNYLEVAKMAEDAGAAAVALHGRSREARYSRAANWSEIGKLRETLSVPVIGNGDILTHYEAEARKQISGAAALMVARGALVKPWIFRELKEQKTFDFSAPERLAIYHRLASYQREHFGADDLGKRRASQFMTYQLNFLTRYRYFPAEQFQSQAEAHPLLQTRLEEVVIPSDPLGLVLESESETVHQELARLLVEHESIEEVLSQIPALAEVARVQQRPETLSETGSLTALG